MKQFNYEYMKPFCEMLSEVLTEDDKAMKAEL